MLSDLHELKVILDIDPGDLSEDVKLWFLVEQATSIIEEFLRKPRGSLAVKSRTEFYNGTGTQKLVLRSRPVFASPTIEVAIDEAGYWGSVSGAFSTNADLTYGTDFCLWIDQDDGTSRSGILVRNSGYWPKPSVRQRGLLTPFLGESFGSIKITYTAGWTVDTLPAAFRTACNLLVARLRYLFPLGMELGGDGYEERSVSFVTDSKGYLLSLVKPLLSTYSNWKW